MLALEHEDNGCKDMYIGREIVQLSVYLDLAGIAMKNFLGSYYKHYKYTIT